jgi:cytochrome b6-f complex iron-sulfur subunit
MSTDSSGSAPQKKLSTAEILAKARAEKAAKAAAEAAASAESAAPSVDTTFVAETPVPVSEAPAAAPVAAAKPKSTADILAAARATAAAKSAAAATGAPESPAASKPKSTADILAAARATAAAKAAGGVAAEAAPAAAAAKPAGAKPAVAATGPKPSVQEMLAAVRSGAAGTAAKDAVAGKDAVAAAGPKAAAPPMPARPAAPVAKKPAAAETRRSFLSTAVAACLSPFWVAWASFAAATLASTLACLRFMLPNVLTEPPSKFKVGPPGDYDLGTVSEKFKAQFGIWIVHTDKFQGKNLVYALSTVCTHLGCTPSWLDGEQKYKCPCHGSGFYITGINFEGPAPRPLERVGLRLAEDGMLEVDKSLKFQEEMGQWNDPASYVEIG